MATSKRATCPAGPQKQCYPTTGAAIRAALSYSKRRGTPLRPYWHHQCKSWHLTRSRKW